jgi:flavin reductase (DIM6/NTAB) family NADH-FMN oxidoreductase RutF
MEKVSLNPGTILCPVPAVMVSCGQGDEKNIITIAWTGIINSQPPITYISVRKSRHSYEIISKEKEFVINLTNRNLAFATDYCGVKSGAQIDKFKEMNLTPLDCQEVKCSMIGEAPLSLECKVIEERDYPTHHMFVAEIVKIHADKALMEENGRLSLEKADLLAYVHGEYFGINRTPIGKFGYSVMKKKTKKRINRELHQKRINANRQKKNDERQSRGKGKRKRKD